MCWQSFCYVILYVFATYTMLPFLVPQPEDGWLDNV